MSASAVVPWWRGRMVTFDLETTAPDPFVARIVSAAVAEVGDGRPTESRTWRVDPGVEIPEEAAAVHGITTEQAQAEGMDAREALIEILDELMTRLAPGLPLVIFNARYDLTVLAAECRRHGVKLPDVLLNAGVVDPLIFEKWLDRFRKTKDTGTRKLEGMCEHYARRWATATGKPVPKVLEGAHDAAFDAIAVARLAWLIASMPAEHAVVRNPRSWGGHYRSDLAERRSMVVEWSRVKDDIDRLHVWTAAEALRERDRFATYKRSVGEHDVADRVESEKGWPFLELPPACEVCGGTEEYTDPIALSMWEQMGGELSDRPVAEPCPECVA